MLYSSLRLGSLHQDLRHSSFRKTALALTAAAFAAGASLATYPASAQQLSSNESGSPACSQIRDNLKGIRCEFDALHQRGIDADKRATAADQRAATADQELACVNLIVADIEKNGEKTANLTAMPPKGQACKTAKDLKLTSG